MKVSEGNQYYLRNVDWVGNSIYTKDYLTCLHTPPGRSITRP
ncbi:MAG: hypothetical protein R2758_16975 [Bacteroidales bacterium]